MTPLEKTPLPPGERMGEGVPPTGRSLRRTPLTLTLSPPFGEAKLRLSAAQATLALEGIGGLTHTIGEATP